MNYKDEASEAEIFFSDCLKTLTRKANDYANNEDCFSNFSFMASVAKIPTERSFIMLLALKLARLSELVCSDKKPNNESIGDTLKDMANYACLMKLYLETDNNNNAVKEGK